MLSCRAVHPSPIHDGCLFTYCYFRFVLSLITKNLKPSQNKLNCFNRIAEMLKQLFFTKDIYNNWKILGDETGCSEGMFEAILVFL